VLAFAVLVGVAVVVGGGFVLRAALKDDGGGDRARPAAATLREVTARRPFLVYQHVARDDHYAEIAVARIGEPTAAPTFTGLVCERVYFAARRGLCLIPKHGALGAVAQARVFDLGFRPGRTARLDGIVSRARVSPSARYGAATTFVTGHSYQDTGFSTSTTLIDMDKGEVIANLERFRITRDGKPFKAIDFNFWGVTFADDRRFYATLQTSGDIYLVEGDVAARRARVIAKGVECPSLSPDRRRIAFKSRRGNAWRLHVLDLETGSRTALAETRSVDDQVEWLDDSQILYGLEGHIWVVPADGSGEPRVYVRNALSPAVVRS
jgi:hypothetical protein